ncbi:MAG: hypothetical protein HQ568_03000 [Calditrichaeota bacterium]|nr:hypothetical protein [Calditrichota bacterium]
MRKTKVQNNAVILLLDILMMMLFSFTLGGEMELNKIFSPEKIEQIEQEIIKEAKTLKFLDPDKMLIDGVHKVSMDSLKSFVELQGINSVKIELNQFQSAYLSLAEILEEAGVDLFIPIKKE